MRVLFLAAVIAVAWVVGCTSVPTDPCAEADQVINTPMTDAVTGDTVTVVTICVFNPE